MVAKVAGQTQDVDRHVQTVKLIVGGGPGSVKSSSQAGKVKIEPCSEE